MQKTPPPPKKAKDKEPAPAPAEGPSGTAHGEVEIWPPNRDNSKWYVEVYNACDHSYTGIGKFTSEVSAEEDAEKVKDAAVEERFTIKYQNEYWQNEVDDDRLQALIDVDAQRIIGRLEAQIATLRAGETPLRHGCRGLFLQPERWDPEIPQS